MSTKIITEKKLTDVGIATSYSSVIVNDAGNIRQVKQEILEKPLRDEMESKIAELNGNVTELKQEIANLPQPDWNQNDSTAADFVKNRTHYEKSEYVDYVLNMDGTSIVGLSMPEVGETMTVKINGVESAETVKETESSIFCFSYKYIGNIDVDSLFNGGTGWVIMLIDGETNGFANPDTTITVEVTVIHKINNKFINFDGFVRTFDYYFKDFSLYKVLYNDNGNECSLYMCNNLILPGAGSQLFGFMSGSGFSSVGSTRSNSCYINGYEIANKDESVSIVLHRIVIGLDTVEMEELAAGYGYTHNTNPKA